VARLDGSTEQFGPEQFGPELTAEGLTAEGLTAEGLTAEGLTAEGLAEVMAVFDRTCVGNARKGSGLTRPAGLPLAKTMRRQIKIGRYAMVRPRPGLVW
jgi:hypothetical protein